MKRPVRILLRDVMRDRATLRFTGAGLACLMFLIGCGTTTSTGSVPAPVVARERPPLLRLDDRAAPRGYELLLVIDPDRERFDGRLTLDLEIHQPIDLLWLNAENLQIESARLETAEGDVAVTVVPGNQYTLGFSFDRVVPAGQARLHLEYDAPLEPKSSEGAFRQQDGGRWYVFTQFESIFARRVIPSFDDPIHKTPWTLTIETPEDNRAYTNTPLVREATTSRNGWRRYEFAPSEPLPTYLVAFAVGPFEEVDAGRVGDTPLRILTLGGKADRARYAAEVTAPILAAQEAYFGIPYAYEKLDSISIPQTIGFGAMENVGLITYIERLILATPAEETPYFQRAYSTVGAHEIAHQWFGNLVTPKWWDDIWLNESFATWMAYRTMMEWRPEWNYDLRRIEARSSAMNADSLATARQIRQPIVTEHDIFGAFDAISYSKGGTLLAGFERWLGEEAFRRGIQSYLRRYAHGNATAADFLEALEEATRPGVARAFSSFLDQSGVPVVSVSLECGGDHPRLRVSQTRYLPLGSEGERDRLWRIPVCVRWGDTGGDGRTCEVMSEPTMTLPLGAGGCPSWVLANDGGLGYYLTRYDDDLLTRLPVSRDDGTLSTAERLSLIEDVALQARGATIPLQQALELAAELADSQSRHLVSASVGLFASLSPNLVPDPLKPRYENRIRELFGERARTLGFIPKTGESEETTLLRPHLVSIVAIEGEDSHLRAEAHNLALAWLENREAVPPDSAGLVLRVAALDGDETLYERYLQALRGEPNRQDRLRLLYGLRAFRQLELVRRTLDLVLDPEIDPRESLSPLSGSYDEEDREIAFAFVREHWDEIVSRIPPVMAARLPRVAGGFCDAAHRREMEAFFRPRVSGLPAGPRALKQTLEGVDLCIARRQIQIDQAEQYLTRQIE